MKNFRGEVSVTAAIIGAFGMIVVAAISSWATSSSAVSDVKTQVATIEERENNHYAEVQKQLGAVIMSQLDINKSLNLLLNAQGLTIKRP